MAGRYGDSCAHYWLYKVTKVKSAMALHLKIHFMSCTNYVENFMLLSKSAQFLAMLLYYYRCLFRHTKTIDQKLNTYLTT